MITACWKIRMRVLLCLLLVSVSTNAFWQSSTRGRLHSFSDHWNQNQPGKAFFVSPLNSNPVRVETQNICVMVDGDSDDFRAEAKARYRISCLTGRLAAWARCQLGGTCADIAICRSCRCIACCQQPEISIPILEIPKWPADTSETYANLNKICHVSSIDASYENILSDSEILTQGIYHDR